MKPLRTPLIAPLEPDADPARYVEFLRDTYRNARRILREPEQQWATGSSHEISRRLMTEAEIIANDIAVEYGLFDPFTGKVVGYSRGGEA